MDEVRLNCSIKFHCRIFNQFYSHLWISTIEIHQVKVLSKFRHQNLVILMGFSRQGAQRLLVYELLSGGDVGSRLQKGEVLTF